MAGLHHRGHEARGRIVAAHGDHLASRHHDVAHLQVGDFEHAFEHGAGVVVDDAALGRGTQDDDEIVAILGLAEGLRDLPEPTAGCVQILGHAADLEILRRWRA